MKIHELAHLSGVNPETIRMYRQKGLLHPARLANGYFDYSACNLYELMFVRKLRGANLRPLRPFMRRMGRPVRCGT